MLYENIFPTPSFFTYTNEKKVPTPRVSSPPYMEIMSQFHVYFNSTLNRELRVMGRIKMNYEWKKKYLKLLFFI